MSAVHDWRASRVEELEQMEREVRGPMDPSGRGVIAVCPTCVAGGGAGTMRRNLTTGELSCDLHGNVTPLWILYPEAA